jgi:hypothetical protein
MQSRELTVSMTVGKFRQMVDELIHARLRISAYSAYLAHETREDKSLHEEYFAILATITYKGIADDEIIYLGNDTSEPDARMSGGHIFEVVQALPNEEHEVRLEIAAGSTSPVTYFKHSADQHQFPNVIVEAIDSKHAKHYGDSRSLIVVFDGDYSFEDDRLLGDWVESVKKSTTRGTFREILLFERSRAKIFPIFNTDEPN